MIAVVVTNAECNETSDDGGMECFCCFCRTRQLIGDDDCCVVCDDDACTIENTQHYFGNL